MGYDVSIYIYIYILGAHWEMKEPFKICRKSKEKTKTGQKKVKNRGKGEKMRKLDFV